MTRISSTNFQWRHMLSLQYIQTFAFFLSTGYFVFFSTACQALEAKACYISQSHHIKQSLFYFLSSSFYGHWRLRGKRNIFPIINFVWLKKKGFRPNEAKQFDIILYMLLYCYMWSFYWAFNQFDMWNVSQTMLPFIIFHSRASSLVWSDIRYTA